MKLTGTEAVFCVSFSRFSVRSPRNLTKMELPVLDSTPYHRSFTPIPVLRVTDAVPLPVGNSLLSENIDFTPSNKQPRCWRGPGFRQQAGSGWSHFFIQMSEYLPDHLRVFNTSNDPDVTTAFTATYGTFVKKNQRTSMGYRFQRWLVKW